MRKQKKVATLGNIPSEDHNKDDLHFEDNAEFEDNKDNKGEDRLSEGTSLIHNYYTLSNKLVSRRSK
jgi:hypothetical protein